MQGLTDLFKSERGVLAILAIVAATVLCAIGMISNQEWLLFAGAVTGVTTISKTFTGVAEIKAAAPVPPPSNAPTIVGPVVGELVVDKPAGGS